MDEASEARAYFSEVRLAPFDSKVDEYFAAHAALETRLAFEREFGALPPTVRGVSEPSARQLLDAFENIAGGSALVAQLLAAYRTATVAASSDVHSHTEDDDLEAILAAARVVFRVVRKEVGGREGGREGLAMLSLFAALRARRECKARFPPRDEKVAGGGRWGKKAAAGTPGAAAGTPGKAAEGSAVEPSSAVLSSFLRNLGQAADVEMLRSEVRDVRASSPVEMPVWEAVLRGWARLREPRLVALATSARQGSNTWTLSAYQQAYRQIPELASLYAAAQRERCLIQPQRCDQDLANPHAAHTPITPGPL